MGTGYCIRAISFSAGAGLLCPAPQLVFNFWLPISSYAFNHASNALCSVHEYFCACVCPGVHSVSMISHQTLVDNVVKGIVS